MYAITYAVKLTQLSMLVKVKGTHQRLNFGGSVDKGCAIFTTSDPAVIEAIEATQKYKDGFIYLYKEYGKRPTKKEDPVVETPAEGEPPVVETPAEGEPPVVETPTEGEVVVPTVETPVTETPVVDDVVEVPAKKVYPETIKTVQGAGRALQADFGVKAKEVETKAKVLAKAIELNVEFPGLAD